jgi:hypothetical protein
VLLGVIVEHMAPSNGHHAGGPAKGQELNAIEQRRQTVAYMVASHHTYREIGDALGVASSTLSDDVKAIREQWRERAAADYASFLAEEMAKLDHLERKVLPQALRGDKNLLAVDRALRIIDRRVRILGLDAPSKVDAVLKVEMIAKALEATVEELGLDATQVRPVLGRRLRELDAVP